MSAITNFENTIRELRSYLAMPIENDRDRAGIIQAFEFTFEQSWKSIQKIASVQGLEIGSPKKAFIVALQNQWILVEDEQTCLQLIKDRNLTSHTYEKNLANEILGRIQSNYLDFFERLLVKLKGELNA